MILLVDIGNSRLKWAYYENAELKPMAACAYTPTTFARVLENQWRGLAKPQAIYVSNVAGGGVMRALTTWGEKYWALTPVCCHSRATVAGVCNAYAEPQRLGVDRWLALIGAAHSFPGQECWVIDCGTAVTADRLDAQGRHLGGLIVPGITTMRRALRTHAAALQAVAVNEAISETGFLLGKNTQDGVKFGTVYALTAFIEKLMQPTDTPIQCVLTGGGAVEIQPLLQCSHTFIADLVLRGIAILVDTRTCA
jgi:type III pantothenate kinase